MRHLIITALAALTLVSCNRDPAYLKQKYLESGNKYFSQKRFKEANIYYRKAIATDPRFGAAYYRLALVDLELQQVPNAYQALRRAWELVKRGTPDSNDTGLKLAEILLMGANGAKDPNVYLKEVQPIVDELLQRNPSSWEGHKLSGDMALIQASQTFKAGNPAEGRVFVGKAIEEYRAALKSKPGDYIVTLALGRTLALDGETGEAEALFKTLLDKDKVNLNGYYELYRIYVGQKKFDEAEATLKSAIAITPKDAGLRLTLAQFYFGTQRKEKLEALLSDMEKNLTLFPQAYLQAGAFYVRVNDFATALNTYENGMKADPDRKNTYLKQQIEVYIRQGNVVMAQTKNDEILHNDPKDPEAMGLRATFMLDKNQVAEAEGVLQTVVTARPNNWVARFNLGRAYFARNQFEQAKQQFDKCIDLNPNYLPARFAQTQVAIVRNDFEGAVQDAGEILKIKPDSVQGRVMMAAALQRLSKYDEARKLLNEVLDKDPKQVETLLELGVLDLNQKKTKDALDHFRRAYEAAPQNIRGLLGESKALLMDGQSDKSVDLIRQAALKTPSFQMQRELGNAQMSARQFDAAIGTFGGLVNGASDIRVKGDLWSRVGESYRYKGDFPKSIEYMELASKALPENAAIATNLALLYEAGQDLPKARTNYEKALKIDKNNPLALNNLAYLITETNGDLSLAMKYANEAKQRLPNFLEVSDTIGWIYLKKNLPDLAVDEFKRLVTQAPLNPIYHYHYAMALKQKGDEAGSKAECDVALANRPQKPLEAQIRTLKASLK